MKAVRIMIVGFGIIGKGLAQTLLDKAQHLKALGYDIKVVAVCELKGCAIDDGGLDLKKLVEGRLKWEEKKTLDAIRDVDADIVVELTPGNMNTGEPGLSHIRAALNARKNVATSNKSPLIIAYGELAALAKEMGVQLRFEATVGGAIPVINTCTSELKANGIRNIYGIFNGTTNFILWKMSEEGVDFKTALKEAQNLGFAESNPDYDIKGIDTAAKVIILANSIMGRDLKLKDLKVTGIEGVTPEALELAKDYGYAIKLVGDVAAAEVSPRMIPVEHPLNVPGNLNAVLVEADTAGDITLIGAGAGPKETSSAILGDILEIADRL
ncbi:MAG: homoserine dehydrogenase [Candidatus Altiarchaeota archaeon]